MLPFPRPFATFKREPFRTRWNGMRICLGLGLAKHAGKRDDDCAEVSFWFHKFLVFRDFIDGVVSLGVEEISAFLGFHRREVKIMDVTFDDFIEINSNRKTIF